MKPFRYGPLTHANAQLIGKQIKEVLAGKLFSVANVTVGQWTDKVELYTNQLLQVDWVDKSDDLVRISVEGEFATIHLCDFNFSYIWNSRLRSGGDHENFTHPYFVFEGDTGFHVRMAVGIHDDKERYRLNTFKVQGDVPWDTDEYHEKQLRIHFAAAGRAIPELV